MSKKHRKNFENYTPNTEGGRGLDTDNTSAEVRSSLSDDAKLGEVVEGFGNGGRGDDVTKKVTETVRAQDERADVIQHGADKDAKRAEASAERNFLGKSNEKSGDSEAKLSMTDAKERRENRIEVQDSHRSDDERGGREAKKQRRSVDKAENVVAKGASVSEGAARNTVGGMVAGSKDEARESGVQGDVRAEAKTKDERRNSDTKEPERKAVARARDELNAAGASSTRESDTKVRAERKDATSDNVKKKSGEKTRPTDTKMPAEREKRRERARLKISPTREDREHAEILAKSSAAGVVGVEVVAGGGAKSKRRTQKVKPDIAGRKSTVTKPKAAEMTEQAVKKRVPQRTAKDETRPVAQAEGEKLAAESEKKQKRESKHTLRKRQCADRPRKHTMPAVLRILCAVLLLAGMAVIFDWFVLWRQNMGDFGATLEFIDEKPLLFAYSGVVIFMLMAVIAAVTWRVCLTVGLSFSIVSIITYINMQKMELRNAPLLPDDLLLADQAGGLMQFIDVWSIVRLVGGVVLILIGTILLERCVRRVIGRETRGLPWWDRMALVPMTAFTMAALAGLASVTAPIINREQPRWLEEELTTEDWNPTATYERNGFIVGFLYNLGSLNTPKPEDYNEETMNEIAQRYKAMRLADEERAPMDEVIDNFIVILDESFYDPALITKYYKQTGGDITPNLHRIFREYPGGYMYSPEYGGNTANVEFEVFTSLSNFWARTFPYVHSIPKSDGVLGIPDWAKNFGFDTLAIHSYDGNMYKRNLVYPKIGFNNFIDADKMSFTEYEFNSGYINDASVFAEILAALENSDDPMMIGAITMQNHMPYDYAGYPTLDFSVTNVDYPLLEADFQTLYMADQYVGEFLEALDELDERTVVLWFGDHAAALLDDYINSDDKDDRDTAHLTPYFIYANFDIESEFTEAEVRKMNAEQGFEFPEQIRGIDLPVMSPNCLQNAVYDILGIEKPSILYLVDEVCRETPILTAAYVADEALEVTQALRDYELVNYDVLSGEHYWDEE